MMGDILIGIDAGTSVIKAVAFDLAGRQLAVSAVPNRHETVGRTGSVQDLPRTFADTVTVLKGLGETIDRLADRLVAIAVTGQGDGTWMIDRDGDPVGPGWLWLDARAGAIVDRLRADATGDAERFARTGSGLAACQQGPQLRYMQDHAPEMLARVATTFHCKDWLYFRLTGMRATDPSEAVFSFGDYRSRGYDEGVVNFLGLSARRGFLPEVVDGATRHHQLTAEAAALTGLKSGTPVVLGYVDVVCTALGAGLYDPGVDTGCSIIGSTGMHMRLAPTPEAVELNAERTGYTMCFPVPGAYAQMQSNMAATLNIDWVLNLAGSLLSGMGHPVEKAELIARIDGWLAEAGETPLVYHPYISEAGERGPFVDASARASLIGLSFSHGFPDLLRAVLDGLSLAARDCYAAMGELPARIRLTGGAARSAALRRIIAGALGAEVQTSERAEAGAAGAAMIAAVSLGLYPDMQACVAEWVRPYQQPLEQPDAAEAARLSAVFPAYRSSRLALRPIWHALDGTAAETDEKGMR